MMNSDLHCKGIMKPNSTLPKNLTLPEDKSSTMANSARKTDETVENICEGDEDFENTIAAMVSKGGTMNTDFKRKPLSAMGILMQGEKVKQEAKADELRKVALDRKHKSQLSKLMHKTPPPENSEFDRADDS